jgi:hypothetical protein
MLNQLKLNKLNFEQVVENVYNNCYVNFEDFYKEFINLVNLRLFAAYTG